MGFFSHKAILLFFIEINKDALILFRFVWM